MKEPTAVLYEYFERIDCGDAQEAVEFFTLDARAEVMTGRIISGRDRIGRALGRILAAYERTSHHVSNVREERTGEQVVLHSYVYAYHRMAATGSAWHLWARLRDVFVRDGDKWLIDEHRVIGVDSTPERREIPESWYLGPPGREARARPLRGNPAREAIAAANPDAAAGMALLRRARDVGDAVSARHTALITACAAAVRGQPIELRAALEEALDRGLTAEEAWATPAILLIARGEEVAAHLAEALIEIFGAPEPRPIQEPPPAPADVFDYLRDVYGEIPARLRLLAERAPAAFEGYVLLHRSALRQGPLAPALVELILCGINAADAQPAFVEIHADVARRVGATEEQIVQAIVAVMPVAGASAWPAAAAALRSP